MQARVRDANGDADTRTGQAPGEKGTAAAGCRACRPDLSTLWTKTTGARLWGRAIDAAAGRSKRRLGLRRCDRVWAGQPRSHRLVLGTRPPSRAYTIDMLCGRLPVADICSIYLWRALRLLSRRSRLSIYRLFAAAANRAEPRTLHRSMRSAAARPASSAFTGFYHHPSPQAGWLCPQVAGQDDSLPNGSFFGGSAS